MESSSLGHLKQACWGGYREKQKNCSLFVEPRQGGQKGILGSFERASLRKKVPDLTPPGQVL